MKPQPLSSSTRERLDAAFAAQDRPEAERLLVNECGNNLPLCQDWDAFELERIRYAALKLSHGDLDRLRAAIDLAKTDWRDLLMGAGFGHDATVHRHWWPGGEQRAHQLGYHVEPTHRRGIRLWLGLALLIVSFILFALRKLETMPYRPPYDMSTFLGGPELEVVRGLIMLFAVVWWALLIAFIVSVWRGRATE